MTVSEKKKDIRLLSLEELTTYFLSAGEKAFRARQVYEWLWQKSATSFEAMTNLSKPLRDKLSSLFTINAVLVQKEQFSNDGTIKSAFLLHDGHVVEGVLIPADGRMTACISSQVGCSLSCSFCATGFLERKRNLEAPEIYDQVVLIARQAEQHFNHPLTNIVLMGMGEPLLNYKNVLEGIAHVTSPEGLGMSPKRITLSTAGIAKMIEKLADDQVRFNLALSLHAANDAMRDRIMPINESNNLEALKAALQYFYKKTGNRITLEYIAFNEENDTPEDARQLIKFAGSFPCKINIIEYNPIDQASFTKSNENRLEAFRAILEEKGLVVNIRRSRGKDIDAACGQLANKSVK
jgi:23S rRNA (adenine2503-C2)-methyltransferase